MLARLAGVWLILGMLLTSFIVDIFSTKWSTPGPLWGLAGMALAALLAQPIGQAVVTKIAESIAETQMNKETK